MSRFWPHAAYAEDQSFARSILWTHVLTRCIQTGAVIGSGVGLTTHLVRTFCKIPTGSLTAQVLRSSGVGVAVTTALMIVGIPARMWAREEIEWKDRSWRLLENRGQVECDDWTYGGMLGGVVMALGRGGGWKSAVGKVGAGGVVGMTGYMGWRYGVKGGRDCNIVGVV